MMKPINIFFGLVLLFLVNAAHGQTAAVTFQVDMNNETVSADGVHIAGGFQGWDPATTLMSDDDLDGIYEVTIELPADSTYEFKFINGMAWNFVEDVPPTCQVEVGGNDNRFLTVGADETQVTYHVCWESCAACGMTTLRLRVDMGNVSTISPNGVHVAGNFQGWDPSGSPMSDADGDGVWESWASFDPLDITDGALLFKFINGNSWANPNENISDETCADAFGHRMLSMTSENMVLSVEGSAFEVPCYNSCSSCVPPIEVTFRVDMTTQETVSENGVHIAGSFQGWDPSANPLHDDDGDGIWETTVFMEPGEIQFKFINGNDWSASVESVTGDCAASDSDNRVLTVGEESIVYEVCYNSCLSVCSGGCTDVWACNFDPMALNDDGSCEYDSCVGCTNQYACNFDPEAIYDDESCEYETCVGCMDDDACNFDPSASIPDASLCTYPGCQDPEASNFDATAGCAGECVYLTYDCASIGDDAWTAEDIGLFPGWQQAMHGVEWAGEWVLNIPATIVEPGSGVVYGIHHMDWAGLEGLPDWVESASYELGELDASSQHCIDAFGTPASPGSHELIATGEVFISIFGQPFSIGEQSFSAWLEVAENPNPIPGCTYANAVNFVSYANDDDGSCLFAGCTDSTAANFNPIATIDDGSCGESCDSAGDSTCQADNDGDGVITVTDLLILLGEFGATCE